MPQCIVTLQQQTGLGEVDGRSQVNGLNFLYMVVWYFAGQKKQTQYIKKHWGKGYPRKSLTVPLPRPGRVHPLRCGQHVLSEALSPG